MSLYIDVKYLGFIGNRLPLFKRKGEYLYNCRCVICGDSQKKKNRARGYFYRQTNDLFYKCHNCEASQHFGTFLKTFDQQLYREYALERYANGENKKAHAKLDDEFKSHFKEPTFFTEVKNTNEIPDIFSKVLDEPVDSEVRKFCDGRNIPTSELDRLWFVSDIKKVETLNDRYENTIQSHEPRLVIPFKNKDGKLVGVSCRGLRDESLRYITVRIEEEDLLIFGIEKVDTSKLVYVVEGPIDSLFLPNAIAVGGTGFNKIDQLDLDKNNMILVLDNQPRNKEVCSVYTKLINKGYKIMIWPDYTDAKDINDLANLGTRGQELRNFIELNSYKDLTAQIKFNTWKKV